MTDRADPKWVTEMFDHTGVDHDRLTQSLIKMGTKCLKTKEMKEMWSEDNPTCNYCYVIAEFTYWYVAPKGTKPYSLEVPSYGSLHRFLKFPDEKIIDLAVEQFYDMSEIDYTKARHRPFMQTGGKGPSKRAKMLAELMGYTKVLEK